MISNGDTVTTFTRGCLDFPIDENAPDRCYNLKNSEHRTQLSPNREIYSDTLDHRKDELTICGDPLCNGEFVDATRYCVDPDMEEGIGKLAAKIASGVEGLVPQGSISHLLMLFLLSVALI